MFRSLAVVVGIALPDVALGKEYLCSCKTQPTANTSRVLTDLRALRVFGASSDHRLGVVRQALSPEDIRARRWLAEKMETEANLTVHLDGIGNTLGIHQGHAPGAAVLMGSHTDTQPEGGWLDGALGVVFALEAARALAEAECIGNWGVANWNDEEGRFGSVVGSAAFIGEDKVTKPEELQKARVLAGLQDVAILRHDSPGMVQFSAYFEAHIEQGRRLQDRGEQVGVVTTIVGLRQHQVLFTGEQNHAGTTPMHLRKDAGMAAMRFAAALNGAFEKVCHGRPSVWTMGKLMLEPGAPSVVPGHAKLTVQFRDPEESHLEAMKQVLMDLARKFHDEGPVTVEVGPQSGVPAVPMDRELQDIIEKAAEIHAPGNWSSMHSGAVHDATNLAKVAPAAMLFVPSVDGISHNFNENTADEDIAIGAKVYVQAAAMMVERMSNAQCSA